VADDPKNLVHVDSKMHRVVDLYQRGRADEAVRLAREVVAEQPKMAAGRELLAFVLQQSEQIPAAIAVLKTLIADGHATDANKVQLALLLTDTGRGGEAAALLETAASSGTNPEVLNGYGVALADQGKVKEAVQQFRRALEVDPNNAPAMQNIGIAALRANDVNTARQHLTRALEMNPRLPLALNTMGVIEARNNDFARALESWQRAVDLDPRQYDALYNIGLVAMRTGRRDVARRALDRFVRTAPRARYARDIDNARQALATL
jgi:Tfp pilus assembly protein PilF